MADYFDRFKSRTDRTISRRLDAGTDDVLAFSDGDDYDFARVAGLIASQVCGLDRVMAGSMIVRGASFCSSPIEKMMFAGLVYAGWLSSRDIYFKSTETPKEHPVLRLPGCVFVDAALNPAHEQFVSYDDAVLLFPQHKVGKFKVDFVVTARGNKVVGSDYEVINESVVVECDGHDFHEKTKEQVAKDKARERAIQSAGFHVLRFSGSEIWKDPIKCAVEVVNFVVLKQLRAAGMPEDHADCLTIDLGDD